MFQNRSGVVLIGLLPGLLVLVVASDRRSTESLVESLAPTNDRVKITCLSHTGRDSRHYKSPHKKSRGSLLYPHNQNPVNQLDTTLTPKTNESP